MGGWQRPFCLVEGPGGTRERLGHSLSNKIPASQDRPSSPPASDWAGVQQRYWSWPGRRTGPRAAGGVRGCTVVDTVWFSGGGGCVELVVCVIPGTYRGGICKSAGLDSHLSSVSQSARDCALWHRESANATQRNGEGAGPGLAPRGGSMGAWGDRARSVATALQLRFRTVPRCSVLLCSALTVPTVHIDCTRINVLVVETIDWIHQSSTVLN